MKLQRSILQISHAKTFKIKYTTGAHKIILSKNIHYSQRQIMCGSNFFYASDVIYNQLNLFDQSYNNIK